MTCWYPVVDQRGPISGTRWSNAADMYPPLMMMKQGIQLHITCLQSFPSMNLLPPRPRRRLKVNSGFRGLCDSVAFPLQVSNGSYSRWETGLSRVSWYALGCAQGESSRLRRYLTGNANESTSISEEEERSQEYRHLLSATSDFEPKIAELAAGEATIFTSIRRGLISNSSSSYPGIHWDGFQMPIVYSR